MNASLRHYGCLRQPRAVATRGYASRFTRASRTGSFIATVLLHCTALALRLLEASSFQCFHKVSTTVRLFSIASGVAHYGFTDAPMFSRTLRTGSLIPTVHRNFTAPSRRLRTSCFLSSAGKQSSRPSLTLGCSHTAPTGRKADAPSGLLKKDARPPPTRGRWPVGRPRLPPSPGFATLRSVVRG